MAGHRHNASLRLETDIEVGHDQSTSPTPTKKGPEKPTPLVETRLSGLAFAGLRTLTGELYVDLLAAARKRVFAVG
jgi:hypothetical protein